MTLVVINMTLQTCQILLQQDDVMGLPMMSLDHENNVPALFSTLLLLTSSVILACIAWVERTRGGADAIQWAILAAGLLLMGVDESLSLHERLIDPLRALMHDSLGIERFGIFYFAWVIPGIALVVALGICFLPFVRRLPTRTGAMLLVSAAIYFGGALGVELAEGWWREGHGNRNVVYHAFVSIEEGMEMIGAILLIHTLLDLLANRSGGVIIALKAREHAVPMAAASEVGGASAALREDPRLDAP
ncbi:hypothetical protein [Aerolutibacter ruishenii]|uniref:Uncharacterized protein n=1 Tax=Aerolutibacter ruishenii TaxID=686800 RepID=A0A562LYM2_9GAMM|nr:hypothetical protein [Lysobacter ruishenii]TWI12749.1 hypothetical protein IP93_01095 [Lysobacter ruishenii]